MAKQKETNAQYLFRAVIPKLTSLGASIVVLGALFKIQHYPGAGYFLAIGLITESVIFFVGTFEPAPPPAAHYDWEKVYPGLSDGSGPAALPKKKEDGKNAEKLAALDQMLVDANLTPETFKSFGQGLKGFETQVGKMKDISNATVATNEYTKNVETASKSLNDLNKAYAGTVNAMSSMANASKDAKEYHAQVQVITKNLGALNAVYEMELKDANSHLKAMNKFYSNLTAAMENMADASKESAAFKTQMSSLTNNLSSLNKIYGNMLAAMKG